MSITLDGLSEFLGCCRDDVKLIIRDICDRNRPFYKKHREFLEWRAEETEDGEARDNLQSRYARCFAPGVSVPRLPPFRKKSVRGPEKTAAE
jgi:hypothetical protein